MSMDDTGRADRHEPSALNHPAGPGAGAPAGAPARRHVSLVVNGRTHDLEVEDHVSLLDVLRDRLDLTGTKRGCDLGQCGACTVLMGGRRVNACLVLAVRAEGQAILTIEGLADGDTLHPVQQAFVDQDAFQCGYCTPGQIMSAVALIAEGRADDVEAIRRHMSGNLCRCGAHANIIAAIRQAAAAMAAKG